MRDIIGERSASTLRPPNQLPVREVSMAVKECTTCKVVKPFSDFHKRKASRDGLMPLCKVCNTKKSIARYWSNPEAKSEYDRQYREKNYEKVIARSRAYVTAHAEQNREKARKLRETAPDLVRQRIRRSLAKPIGKEKHLARGRQWRARNPAIASAWVAKRRAAKLNATPSWAIPFFIAEAYSLARLRQKLTGIRWHVDHIVPLRGKTVCGLHVHHNLQVIPATLNHRKTNRIWPDMP